MAARDGKGASVIDSLNRIRAVVEIARALGTARIVRRKSRPAVNHVRKVVEISQSIDDLLTVRIDAVEHGWRFVENVGSTGRHADYTHIACGMRWGFEHGEMANGVAECPKCAGDFYYNASRVYLLQIQHQTMGTIYKIGNSKDIDDRIRALGLASGVIVKLICSIAFDHWGFAWQYEQSLHLQLRANGWQSEATAKRARNFMRSGFTECFEVPSADELEVFIQKMKDYTPRRAFDTKETRHDTATPSE
jgi:hypothetical protein